MRNLRKPPEGLLSSYQNALDFGRKTQADHSKWLINTLYLLHSGAIAGILSRMPLEKIPLFVGAIVWFVVGLAFAFLAGLATWANYEFYIRTYAELIKRIRRNQWKSDELPDISKFVGLSAWLALLIGFVSFICLAIGAFSTLCVLKSLST